MIFKQRKLDVEGVFCVAQLKKALEWLRHKFSYITFSYSYSYQCPLEYIKTVNNHEYMVNREQLYML